MGTFEFENTSNLSSSCSESRRPCEECIIANKIFDQCRQQKCLTPAMLGPARAAKTVSSGCNEIIREGDIIVPPCNATSVSIKDFELSHITILCKKPNPFRCGFWDIDLKYIFRYSLVFRSSDNCEICCISAFSTYTTKVTLFGSAESDIVSASDLYSCQDSLSSGPFVNVEGKAIALSAELKFASCDNNCGCDCCCDCCCDCGCSGGCNTGCGCGCDNTVNSGFGSSTAVLVTIGLFTVIKMFRPVNMIVNTLGYCVPEECKGSTSCDDPCDFFNSIEFPMNLFAPVGTGDYMHHNNTSSPAPSPNCCTPKKSCCC